ncbi:autophagy protein Apg5-domain-containing protein [Plectosphaerella plurivora]|uniref:Autophagy protein 5 n=1 Tax=Plectosphaerella plurivora TaxID=936078 RepID=A0A9P8VPC8_9PEZI|nr:autophagy protein Apg5-domain-containing protein [Plectosphaerella plurivora]
MPPIAPALWAQHIPLLITHPSHPNTPFITSLPRFAYLALLLPRLSAFFSAPSRLSSFHHEDVLLRNLPLGLLVDLYNPPLPWRLTVSDGPGWDIADTFINSAKEADYVRYGNAKTILSLSKDDTSALWNAVLDNDYRAFAPIASKLLNPALPLKNIPLRIYVPSAPPPDHPDHDGTAPAHPAGAFKVIQALVPPRIPGTRQPQLTGAALRSLLPTLFPSSRDPVLANAILHGAPVPFDAPIEDLMREAAYPDGWLCIIVSLL